MKLFLLVDAVFDFLDAKEGVFHQCYGDDAAPLLSMVPIWKQVLDVLSSYKDVTLAIVGSNYTVSQFRTKGLENLCVSEKGRAFDATFLSFFSTRIFKNGNSVIDGFVSLHSTQDNFSISKKQDLLDWLHGFEQIWIAGITTCSCIAKTISSLQLTLHSHQHLLVSEDCISCRASQEKSAQKMIQQWKQQTKQMTVYSSYKQLLIDFITE